MESSDFRGQTRTTGATSTAQVKPSEDLSVDKCVMGENQMQRKKNHITLPQKSKEFSSALYWKS